MASSGSLQNACLRERTDSQCTIRTYHGTTVNELGESGGDTAVTAGAVRRRRRLPKLIALLLSLLVSLGAALVVSRVRRLPDQLPELSRDTTYTWKVDCSGAPGSSGLGGVYSKYNSTHVGTKKNWYLRDPNCVEILDIRPSVLQCDLDAGYEPLCSAGDPITYLSEVQVFSSLGCGIMVEVQHYRRNGPGAVRQRVSDLCDRPRRRRLGGCI